MLDQGGWGRADLVVLQPAPALADVVEFFWVDEWSAARRPLRRFRIVADDAPHIIWHLYGGRHRSETLGVVGARSTYRDLDVSTRMVTVGVRLRPGVVPLLTGTNARLLTDRTLHFTHRLPHGRGASPERVLDSLSNYIGERTTRQRAHRFAEHVRSLDPRGSHGIADIARDLDINERSLRNLSHAQVGMSLKRFLRIRRLHAALGLAHSHTRVSWSRVASESSYADQAHLIRECHALLGETPATFLRRAAE